MGVAEQGGAARDPLAVVNMCLRVSLAGSTENHEKVFPRGFLSAKRYPVMDLRRPDQWSPFDGLVSPTTAFWDPKRNQVSEWHDTVFSIFICPMHRGSHLRKNHCHAGSITDMVDYI